jgi:hypothetical protein
MTRSDDQMQGALPTQKLEWVTPKIALIEAEDTAGKLYNQKESKAGGVGPS